ncbi:unnamed protein product [Tenebrio molitor]|nr:unnamed protein product [Tenebrio molitor]
MFQNNIFENTYSDGEEMFVLPQLQQTNFVFHGHLQSFLLNILSHTIK